MKSLFEALNSKIYLKVDEPVKKEDDEPEVESNTAKPTVSSTTAPSTVKAEPESTTPRDSKPPQVC